MAKIWQEFYCNDCSGYFRVKLDMALNIKIKMCCPNCGHPHPRATKDGQIVEYNDGIKGSYEEEVHVPKSAYSKEPFTSRIKANARDGAVIESADHIRDVRMRELWFEYFGGGQGDE